MNDQVILYACFMVFGVFISSISQVLLKKSALKKHSSIITEYMNPLVIIAYIIFVAATILSVLSYRKVPLSMGPVLEATSYIFVTFFGVKIFKEKMNRKKWIALIMIICGVIIYSIFG